MLDYGWLNASLPAATAVSIVPVLSCQFSVLSFQCQLPVPVVSDRTRKRALHINRYFAKFGSVVVGAGGFGAGKKSGSFDSLRCASSLRMKV